MSADWLKLDVNGEPYEATLADGTVLKLETYGEEYDAYEYRPPLTGAQADFVFGTDRGPNVGWGDLAIDAKHKTIYWREGSSKVTRIMRAALNGAGAGPLMDFNDLSPTHIAPDPVHGKLYWYTRGLPNGSGRAIYRANLDGKNARPIIRDIDQLRNLAIDPDGNKLYYLDASRLIQTELDGNDEVALSEARGWAIAVDHDAGKIYWSDGRSGIRRANLDGSNVENVVENAFGSIALDARNGLIYWQVAHSIRRARLDGSQTENVVVDVAGNTDRIALDLENGYVLWCATDHKNRGRTVGLWRAKLPPVAKSTRRPAPPLIRTIAPEAVGPGDEVMLTGTGFNGAKEVLVLDDGTGENAKASFTVRSDRELVVIAPRMSKRSRRPLLVVRNAGGITVTVPRGVGASRHASVDRFHPDDKFAYVVPSGEQGMIDRGAVLAMGSSVVTPGERGHSTFFLKNGARVSLRRGPNNLVFFEPFALVPSKEASKGSRLVPVSAIRPSFVGSVLEYKRQ